MAAITEMTKAQKEELLCTYAAMILHDEQMDITSDNLTKLIKAAGASVEPFLPALFARALAATSVKDLLTSAGTVGGGGGAGAAGGSAPAATSEAAPAKAAEEEPEEEEEGDMGFSLFD